MYWEETKKFKPYHLRTLERINTTYVNSQFESKFVDGIGFVLVEYVENVEVVLSNPFPS